MAVASSAARPGSSASAGRRFLVGTNVAVATAIVVAVVVVAQLIAFRLPGRLDMTSTGVNSLSEGSEKLLRGVRHACYKLPITEEAIEQLVDTVEGDLFERFNREVPSQSIGEILLRRLRELNHVAYVRFAAVFRQYCDVDQFVDEIHTVRDLAAAEIPEQGSLFE